MVRFLEHLNIRCFVSIFPFFDIVIWRWWRLPSWSYNSQKFRCFTILESCVSVFILSIFWCSGLLITMENDTVLGTFGHSEFHFDISIWGWWRLSFWSYSSQMFRCSTVLQSSILVFQVSWLIKMKNDTVLGTLDHSAFLLAVSKTPMFWATVTAFRLTDFNDSALFVFTIFC